MFQWFRRAADAGDDGAFVELAKCYASGLGTEKNPVGAKSSLLRALKGWLSDWRREEARRLLTLVRKR